MSTISYQQLQSFLSNSVGLEPTTATQYATLLWETKNNINYPIQISDLCQQQLLQDAGIEQKLHQVLITRAAAAQAQIQQPSSLENITTTSTTTTAKKVAPRLNVIHEPKLGWGMTEEVHPVNEYIGRIFLIQQIDMVLASDPQHVILWSISKGTQIASIQNPNPGTRITRCLPSLDGSLVICGDNVRSL
jgi:hypothetical protein